MIIFWEEKVELPTEFYSETVEQSTLDVNKREQNLGKKQNEWEGKVHQRVENFFLVHQ